MGLTPGLTRCNSRRLSYKHWTFLTIEGQITVAVWFDQTTRRRRMQGTSYVHMLKGRLRIKVSEIKGSPVKAVKIESTVSQIKGVSHVKANELTGNLLVLFDPDLTNHYHIIGTLKDLGCLNEVKASAFRPSTRWSEAVVGPIAQVVIERAILALI
jgi:Heavy metal associated domain 2